MKRRGRRGGRRRASAGGMGTRSGAPPDRPWAGTALLVALLVGGLALSLPGPHRGAPMAARPLPAGPLRADLAPAPLLAPEPGQIVGRVALQGRTEHAGAELSIDGTPRATSDARGDYRIDDVAPGKHVLQARAPGYLCNQIQVRTAGEAGTTARGLYLTGGDPIPNDTVDLFDLVVVAASYNRDPLLDPRADINQDGLVNLFDMVLVAGNYGRRCPLDQVDLAPEVPVETALPGGTATVFVTTTVTTTPEQTAVATQQATATPDGGTATEPPAPVTPDPASTPAAMATGRPDAEAVVAAVEARIRIIDGAFEPHTVYASPGAWITWLNEEDQPHALSIPGAALSITLAPGEHFNWRVPAAGTFGYHCAIHRTMEGMIVVMEDPSAATDFFGGRSIQAYYTMGCSSCHGLSRQGAIGPALVPGRLTDDDRAYFDIIRDGRPGTSMPAWGRGGLGDDEIWGLVGFLRSSAEPEALTFGEEQIRASLRVLSDEATLPGIPNHQADLDALMLVTERESRSIAVLDGVRHELVGRIGASYRAHGYAFDPTNDRWAFNVGRDGWVSRIDLYTLRATRQVRVGLDSRGIAISDDGQTLIVGNYIPTSAVILDARTLLPRKVIATEGVDPDGQLVASRVCITSDVSPDLVGPYFLLGLKEAGQVWRIDWSDPDYPIDKLTDVGRILHDGFLDETNERFYIASQTDDSIAVIDVANWSLLGQLETGDVPHPGSGAVWQADERDYGATVHAGEGMVTIWDLASMEIVGHVPTSGPGLFLRAAKNSPYVWADAMFAVEPHEITVFEKAPPFTVVGRITDGVQTLHPEFTADGNFVYVSDWQGDAVRIYDAHTLERVKTIEGIRAPTGIFGTARRSERLGH